MSYSPDHWPVEDTDTIYSLQVAKDLWNACVERNRVDYYFDFSNDNVPDPTIFERQQLSLNRAVSRPMQTWDDFYAGLEPHQIDIGTAGQSTRNGRGQFNYRLLFLNVAYLIDNFYRLEDIEAYYPLLRDFVGSSFELSRLFRDSVPTIVDYYTDLNGINRLTYPYNMGDPALFNSSTAIAPPAGYSVARDSSYHPHTFVWDGNAWQRDYWNLDTGHIPAAVRAMPQTVGHNLDGLVDYQNNSFQRTFQQLITGLYYPTPGQLNLARELLSLCQVTSRRRTKQTVIHTQHEREIRDLVEQDGSITRDRDITIGPQPSNASTPRVTATYIVFDLRQSTNQSQIVFGYDNAVSYATISLPDRPEWLPARQRLYGLSRFTEERQEIDGQTVTTSDEIPSTITPVDIPWGGSVQLGETSIAPIDRQGLQRRLIRIASDPVYHGVGDFEFV